jgi:iron complex outermembrane receptor protein
MSESNNTRGRRNEFHLQLLATASFAALIGAGEVHAADADHPIVWLELDGQYAQAENSDVSFIPPFAVNSPFPAASQAGSELVSSIDWEKGATISFTPADSGWVVQAGLRYGKSSKHLNEDHVTAHGSHYYHKYHAYQNVTMQGSESHAIVDFKVGKDVGLGSFGNNGSSTFSFGVRYAQLNSRGTAHIQSQPLNSPERRYGYPNTMHRFYADFAARRKYSGVGPSLSWDASAILVGNSQADSSIAFEWGAIGAILFGRQRTQIEHQTTENLHTYGTSGQYIQHYRHAGSPDRNRAVTVSNLGGLAGVSWRYSAAKVMLGYRADFFFGAIDGGIDTAHRENRGFYGPFASVSVGLGG